jgi:hypothetical protein
MGLHSGTGGRMEFVRSSRSVVETGKYDLYVRIPVPPSPFRIVPYHNQRILLVAMTLVL